MDKYLTAVKVIVYLSKMKWKLSIDDICLSEIKFNNGRNKFQKFSLKWQLDSNKMRSRHVNRLCSSTTGPLSFLLPKVCLMFTKFKIMIISHIFSLNKKNLSLYYVYSNYHKTSFFSIFILSNNVNNIYFVLATLKK